MSSRRVVRLFLVVVVVVLALAPALALANGPSAGDNQYTDPLAGSTTSHSSPPPKTTPAPTTTPPAPTSSAPSTAAPPVSPSTPPVTPSTGTTGDPSGATSSSAPSAGTLPLTGFDAWVAAALGAVMLSIGIVLRRRLATR